jgi:NADH-quinone oxidoreductase subunit H
MQFALLILIPVTLGNILLTALIYLILSSLGLPNLVFLIVLGMLNFILLGGFIRVINRATLATTRHAQSPALYARRRAADAAQLPVRAGVASTSQK